MLTIKMNDAAASALQVGAVPLHHGATVDPELRGILADGLTIREGALLFTQFDQQDPAAPGDVVRAIERMGWPHLTWYECQRNSFHLEHDEPGRADLNEDGVPRISEAGQVSLLRLGLLLAGHVIDLARALPTPVPVRCIISANETTVNFRFHRLRDGESWNVDDLDRYELDKVVTVDSHLPNQSR